MKPHSDTIGYQPTIELCIVDADGDEYTIIYTYEKEWILIHYKYCHKNGGIDFRSTELEDLLKFMEENIPEPGLGIFKKILNSVKPYTPLMEEKPKWWKH